MTKNIGFFLSASILFAACGEQQTNTNSATTNTSVVRDSTPTPASKPTQQFTYRAIRTKDSLAQLRTQYDSNQLHVIYALNRVDEKHVSKLDTLIVPDKVEADIMPYSPFPQNVPGLKDVDKIIFFSYPAEAFGAYEHGNLVRWGTTNMGREKDPTPTGLTYVNWKKEVDTSSVKDEWILKWNVNILNKGGVGFHEYDMPGYPASHSCLRLSDTDAHYLYTWADQWVLKDKNDVKAHGTPVIVFGAYPFGGRKPWLALAQNPHALDMSANDMQQIVQPKLGEIMTEQQKLNAVKSQK